MSRVLLGLPGSWADNYREVSDLYTTKIGGLPDLPVPELVASSSLLECDSCGSKLCLIAQIYAPISSGDTKIEERQIYVFGCLRPKCGTSAKSWKALRVQSSHDLKKVHSPSKDATPFDPCSAVVSEKNKKWWDSFDEDDDEDIDLDQLGKALSEAASLASHSRKQNSHRHSETIVKPLQISNDVKTQVLPCFYIYTEEEPPTKDIASICKNYSSISIKEEQNSVNDQVEEEAWEAEKYEYDKALTADRTYLKFKKRLDANPEQCFRYSYGGKPLLASADRGDNGRCSLCSEPMHFEVQLMPPLLYFLQEAADISQKETIDNWNWMTLIVYTCSKSCFPSDRNHSSIYEGWTVAEEAVIVQYENSLHGSDQLGYFS